MAHWGNTHLTGRGLAALVAPGHTYQVTLGEGEELVVHPSHVVAYAVNKNPPLPFRLRSAALRLQVPSVPASLSGRASALVPEGWIKFWKAMRDTATYKFLARFLFGLRTAARRSIWGDRLFLQFRGPSTLLMSSRGVRVADVLSSDDVNEIADTEAGAVPEAVELASKPKQPQAKAAEESMAPTGPTPFMEQPVSIHVAQVGQGGKVKFEDTKDLKEFVR